MEQGPCAIVKLPGRWTLIFPDGSALHQCQRRRYASGFCEWYVFRGHQFTVKDLARWGVQITQEAEA
jgi:hypothetical protein